MSTAWWLAALLAAAPGPTPAPTPAELEGGVVAPIVREKPRPPGIDFSHRVHMDAKQLLSCESCHALLLDGNRSRSTPEALCVRCHEKDERMREFRASVARAKRPARTGSPPPLHRIHAAFACTGCHSNQLLSDKVGDFPLPPHTNRDPVCVACHGKQVRFSHAMHLAVEGKVAAQCDLCHKPTEPGILYSTPAHAECWACHDITLLGLTEGCNLCHLEEVRGEKTFNIENASLRHKQHRSLACADCHAPILTARSIPELKLARDEAGEASCIRCHAAE